MLQEARARRGSLGVSWGSGGAGCSAVLLMVCFLPHHFVRQTGPVAETVPPWLIHIYHFKFLWIDVGGYMGIGIGFDPTF